MNNGLCMVPCHNTGFLVDGGIQYDTYAIETKPLIDHSVSGDLATNFLFVIKKKLSGTEKFCATVFYLSTWMNKSVVICLYRQDAMSIFLCTSGSCQKRNEKNGEFPSLLDNVEFHEN